MAFGLRIAPCIGAPDLARLRRIEPLDALEQQSIVLRRETPTEISLKWDNLRLDHRGREEHDREPGCQPT